MLERFVQLEISVLHKNPDLRSARTEGAVMATSKYPGGPRLPKGSRVSPEKRKKRSPKLRGAKLEISHANEPDEDV